MTVFDVDEDVKNYAIQSATAALETNNEVHDSAISKQIKSSMEHKVREFSF